MGEPRETQEKVKGEGAQSGDGVEGEPFGSAGTRPAPPTSAKDIAAAFEARLAASDEEKERLRDSYLRALADLDNYRKRALRERDEVAARTRSETLVPILEILDDLDRALSESASERGPLTTGVALIRDKMEAVLRQMGVTPIETAGARFDPALHESFGGLPTADAEPHAIVQE